MRGKWAQGIVPRHFQWVIKERLAICERPGGYGDNHRRVRRQEEIIWIRENDFTSTISLIPAPHNLHNYDELNLPYRHRPFPDNADLNVYLPVLYDEIESLLNDGGKLMLHREELGDPVAGLIGGYLRWIGAVDNTPECIVITERLLERQLGPYARNVVTVSGKLIDARNAE